ncbi:hypothetical protein [Methylobacterium aquaticum]|jgi:hypothetical protein|uniref:hypothetical protein n=1 Tax=Methylobacterium aquaticum TaxID=270351 RepID=UPI0012E206D4|nr:hypothetical protein [Methylobacterium aquaticum]
MPAVQLSPAERDALEKWAGRRKTAQGLAVRARILLRADEGASNKAMPPTSPSIRPSSASGATAS